MMKKRALSAAIALAISAAASAGEYQFEAGIGYGETEEGRVEAETWAIGGDFYFKPVDDSKGPLAEAAFLNKASYIGLAYADLEVDFPGGSADGDVLSIDGEYVLENSGLILGARYSQGEIEDFDLDSWGLTAGFYLGDATAVRVNYDTLDDEEFDSDSDILGVTLHHLTGEIGNGLRIGLDANVDWVEEDSGSDSYDGIAVGVGADLYLSNAFSIGAGFDVFTGDDELEGDAFDLRARYFFTPKVAVGVSYSELDYDEADDALESWNIELTGRF